MLLQPPVSHRPKAPASRSTGTKVFPFLFVTAWLCVGALIKWDARWLYLLLGLTVIAGLWAGRPRALPRVLLLLALVFPVWKKVEQRPHPVAAGVDAAATGEKAAPVTDDAAVISALVTDEETYLTLSPKMSALSKGLLNLRLPGPGAQEVFAASVSVSDIGPAPATTATGENMMEPRTWPAAATPKQGSKVDLWRPLLD